MGLDSLRVTHRTIHEEAASALVHGQRWSKKTQGANLEEDSSETLRVLAVSRLMPSSLMTSLFSHSLLKGGVGVMRDP